MYHILLYYIQFTKWGFSTRVIRRGTDFLERTFPTILLLKEKRENPLVAFPKLSTQNIHQIVNSICFDVKKTLKEVYVESMSFAAFRHVLLRKFPRLRK